MLSAADQTTASVDRIASRGRTLRETHKRDKSNALLLSRLSSHRYSASSWVLVLNVEYPCCARYRPTVICSLETNNMELLHQGFLYL